VILKRGMSATISEWLMSAEYIAAGGNHNIIFCERGIRTFETAYRNVLDVTAIPVLKKETHLPVIVDPSHAGGKAWMVPALSQAAIAAGADGLLIEMHPNPCEAWCDADQALTPQELKNLMGTLGASGSASACGPVGAGGGSGGFSAAGVSSVAVLGVVMVGLLHQGEGAKRDDPAERREDQQRQRGGDDQGNQPGEPHVRPARIALPGPGEQARLAPPADAVGDEKGREAQRRR